MKKLLLTYISLLFSVWALAQASGMPYSCSFEEDENLSNWVLNYNTPDATDKWVVGSATHSEGKRSLYISTDGKNPGYGSHPNVVAAYLPFKFPDYTALEHSYDISFDWRGMGDSVESKLYVMVCPELLLTYVNKNNYCNLDEIVSSTSGIISPKVITSNGIQQLGDSKERFVCGSEKWQNVSLSNVVGINSNNYTYAIVFIWVNNNSNENIKRSGICIDNLQISSALLKKPRNVEATPQCGDSTMLISWESGLSKFEVQYRPVGSSTWRRADGLEEGIDGFSRVDGTQCSYVLRHIMEGSYDVRVRGKSKSGLYTNYVYKNNVFVYCPENHCVDYLNLYASNVLCTYGYHPNTNQTEHKGETPYTFEGIIDFGPDSEESRHTIHTNPTETDPRTDDELFTVPPGALASVRLGNWKQTGEAEAITYNFTVDAENQGVLIVRYATVVEASGHPREGEPFFRLEVLDENDQLIDESCGHADYAYSDAVASGDMSGWHISKNDPDIAWKEWTTVGVNLMPYAGQDVKVRFTTSDCFDHIHFGYAYFTVDCANAHIETENCGNDPKITCNAPEGFSYMWFNEAGEVVSIDRELSVDPSRQTYTCRVSFIEDPTCYFEVSTVSAPRFPVPSYKVEPIYEECLSKLKFTSTSHVMNKYDGEEHHTAEPCQDYYWTFRSLTDNSLYEAYSPAYIYTCKPEGDTIEVTHICYIGAENSCDSMRVDTIITRNIHPGSTELSFETCPESPLYYDSKWFTRDTTYVMTYPNFAECDSVSTMHLKVWPEIRDLHRHDSICSDQYIVINGESYNQPMEEQLFMLKSVHGCDSAVYVTLTVNERLKKQMAPYSYSCADDEVFYIGFDISAGQFDSLRIEFDTPQLRDTTIFDPNANVIAIPFPASILPGHYMATLTFYQFCCGLQMEKRAIEILYRSSIVEQKWNDVLTLLSPQYNGGFEFSAIQWYKNGQPMENETNPYLYQPLDFNAEYQALLTRADGISVLTCPVQPIHHEQQTPFPTIVQVGQQLPVYMETPTTVWYFTISGQLYSTFTLPRGYSMMTMPMQQGVFVLKSTNQKGETQAQVMIVE